MAPEQEIFQAVIERALMDAFWDGEIKNKGGIRSEAICARDQADTWLRGMSKDFKTICHLAGIDPHFLRDNYVAGKIDRVEFYNAQAAKSKSRKSRWRMEAA